ncbi:MAG TPA: DPP IV N-terminal domain-containing protein, partial [Gemmatimonadales bacterium]|nr:DPP IV N-terminal domain-containing protein [Gemmatimonadales bacterium]
MRYVLLCLLFTAATPAAAQQRPQLTAADYARAEKFLGYNATPLVFGAAVRPTWLPDGRFWYRNTISRGTELILVDPLRKTRGRAFDQARLAAALSTAAGTPYDSLRLPITQFEFSADKQSITFETAGRRWTCGVVGDRCSGVPAARSEGGSGRNAVLSPDGKRAAFIRDYNLWVRDVPSGRETRLTTDGVKDFGYATDNAGWIKSDRPVLLWSPDSRKLATFQQDERAVG